MRTGLKEALSASQNPKNSVKRGSLSLPEPYERVVKRGSLSLPEPYEQWLKEALSLPEP